MRSWCERMHFLGCIVPSPSCWYVPVLASQRNQPGIPHSQIPALVLCSSLISMGMPTLGWGHPRLHAGKECGTWSAAVWREMGCRCDRSAKLTCSRVGNPVSVVRLCRPRPHAHALTTRAHKHCYTHACRNTQYHCNPALCCRTRAAHH